MGLAEPRAEVDSVRCPHCRTAGALRRSHTRWWERPLRLVTSKRPYRCWCCERRAWIGVTHAPGVGDVRPVG